MISQTVLGIDVGLRNLSLCIMSKSNKGDYEILLWDNYNLLGNDPEICLGKTRTGIACSKFASVFNPATKEYFCKMHSKGVHVKNVPKCKNVKTYLIQDIARIVLSKITEIHSENKVVFSSISKVFIENQPKINNKMKIVSTLILGKLTELLDNSVAIRFISATNKLKIGNIVCSDASKDGTRGPKGYNNRKKLSVEYTRSFLKNNKVKDTETWSRHFENRKKLNDMADSLGFCICTLGK